MSRNRSASRSTASTAGSRSPAPRRYAAEYPRKGVRPCGARPEPRSRRDASPTSTRRAAEKAPGVLAVITHANAPQDQAAAGQSPRQHRQPRPRRRPLLQDDRVHYVGQSIAVVVADTLEQARHAASLVEVTYEPERAADGLRRGTQARRHAPKGPIQRQAAGHDPRRRRRRRWPTRDVKVERPTRRRREPQPDGAARHRRRLGRRRPDGLRRDAGGLRRADDAGRRLRPAAPRTCASSRRSSAAASAARASTWPHVAPGGGGGKARRPAGKLVLDAPQMFGSVGYRPHTVQQRGARRDEGRQADGDPPRRHAPDVADRRVHRDRGTASRACSTPARTCHDAPLSRAERRHADLHARPGESTGYVRPGVGDGRAGRAPSSMDPVELRLRNYADADPKTASRGRASRCKECYRIGGRALRLEAAATPQPRSMRDGRCSSAGAWRAATYPMNRGPASALARIFARRQRRRRGGDRTTSAPAPTP